MTIATPRSKVWWTWVALGSALFLYLFITGIPMLVSALAARPWDGIVDWTVAKAWLAGTNPYTPEALKAAGLPVIGHPPTTGFWFLPLTQLSVAMMSQVLGHLILVLLFLQTLWLGRVFQWPTPMLLAGIVVIWTLSTTWMQYHLYIGQVSELLGFCFVVGWLALRRRWDVAGGLVLGAALTIKLFPALVLFYLLLQRRWRAIFAAAAVYVTVAVVMTARVGFGAWRLFVEEEGGVVKQWIGNPHNSTLAGLWTRFLSPECGWVRTIPSKALLAATLSTVLLFVITYAFSRRKNPIDPGATDHQTFDLTYFAMVVLSVLGNPFAYGHYTVIYLPVALIVAEYGWRARLTWPGKVTHFLLLAVVILWQLDINAMDRSLSMYHFFGTEHVKFHLLEATQWTPPFLLLICLWILLKKPATSTRTSA